MPDVKFEIVHLLREGKLILLSYNFMKEILKVNILNFLTANRGRRRRFI